MSSDSITVLCSDVLLPRLLGRLSPCLVVVKGVERLRVVRSGD